MSFGPAKSRAMGVRKVLLRNVDDGKLLDRVARCVCRVGCSYSLVGQGLEAPALADLGLADWRTGGLTRPAAKSSHFNILG